MYTGEQAVRNSGRSDANGACRGGELISMTKRDGCRFNCRERALLPWLFLGGIAFALLAGAHCGANAAAQQQPAQSAAPAPVFDVAAIHLHIPEPHEHNSIWSSPTDGRFRAENISVIDLIHWAYEMPETRILGAPGWAHSAYFDIDAKADPSIEQQLHNLTTEAGRKQKEEMVQALLADRFGLVVHIETRELPIYVLVVAKGGPKMGAVQETGSYVNTGNGRIEVQMQNSVAVLAEELSKAAGRDVVDKTGMTGRYHLKLQWTPDDAAAPSSGNGAASDSGPSLFTAIEEQLGLKLESAKGPVEVLVVDHVEMPSQN
jgi:uncharacterized protein (TIGR03435 family)